MQLFQNQVKSLCCVLRSFRLVLVLFVLLLTGVFSYTREGESGRVHAATSSNLNFQARLLTASGTTVPDGYYNVQFKLYNVSSGGSSLWTESYYDSNGGTAGNDNRVRVVNGYLSVNLASQTAFPAINWDQDMWLTMNVGGAAQTATPTYDGEMTPRIKLTAVPYAFQAKQSETLVKNQGTYTGTVDFSTLTADRKYLFPDTSLATTASPGTICVYNGAASNCPAASGSAYYIQNDTVLQLQSNYHIQARDNGVAGTIGGIIRGAAAGQTADLFQLQGSNGTVLSHFAANGNLAVGTAAAPISVLTVGTDTTTAAGGITFGTDTNLYRMSANTLKTDGSLVVGVAGGTGTLTVNGSLGSITTSSTGNNLNFSRAGSNYINATDAAGTLLLGAGGNNGNIQINANGSTYFKNSTDSTTALQVQNAAGYQILNIDTATNTNLLANPGFEVDTSGWTARTGTTLTRIISQDYYGVAGGSLVNTATANAGVNYPVTLAPSTAYAFSFYTKLASGTMTTLQAGRADNGTETACTLSTATTLTTGWTRHTCTFTTGATISGSYVFIRQSDAVARTVYLDAARLETGTVAKPYSFSNISLAGTINTPAVYQSTSDSTTAFQIQNAAGTGNTFVVDTINNGVGIGRAAAAGYSLITAGNIYSGAWTYSTNGLIIPNASTSAGAIIKYSTTSSTTAIAQYDVVSFESGTARTGPSQVARDTRVYGVAYAAAAVNAANLVVIGGNHIVNVDTGAVAIGDQLVTSATPGRATVDNNATTGIVGTALTAKAAGANGTVNIMVRPVGGQNSPTFRNATDTAEALKIQNAAGQNLLVADTLTQRLAVGPAAVPANGVLTVGADTTTASGGLYFGTDTNLYRSNGSVLKTDGAFIAQTSISTAGSLSVGTTLTFGNGDTNLYRGAADTLRTDDKLVIQAPTTAGDYTPSLQIGTYSMNVSSSGSTAVSSWAAWDATDDRWEATTTSSVVGPMLFESNYDGTYTIKTAGVANRTAGDALAFTDALKVQSTGRVDLGAAGGKTTLQLTSTAADTGITFGTDTNLYRSAANQLTTDDDLIVAGNDLYIGSTSGVRLENNVNDLRLHAQGGEQLRIDANNIFTFNNNIIANTAGTAYGAKLSISTEASGNLGIITRGVASQTADLFQLQDSNGVILTSFQADGKLAFGPSGAQDTNLYRSAANTLATDSALIVQGLLTGNAGATLSGAAISLNANSNFDTNINTGTSTGAVNIGNNLAGDVSVQSAGAINIGSSGTANTVQIGNTTGAVIQNVNIGNNATASSTTNVTVGSSVAGATIIQNAATISLNAPAVDSNATTLALFSTPTTITFGNAASTFNIGPGGVAAATINFAGGSTATGCTVDGATGNLACSGNIIGNATGTVGYFSRTGTTLQPATAGDSIQTTSSGAITSAGILSANATGKTALTIADSGAQLSGLTIGGDTNLYRSAANELKTDDDFSIGGDDLRFGTDYLLNSASDIFNISNLDGDQLRITTNGLYTYNNFIAANNAALSYNSKLAVGTDSNSTVGITVRGHALQTADLMQLQDSAGTILTSFDKDGRLVFGPSGSQDTSLYRSAADTLKTDDKLQINSTTALGRLNVASVANEYSGFFSSANIASQSYGMIINAGTNAADLALQVRDAAWSNTYLMVRGDGNVGIGSATPSTKLSISGTGSANGITFGEGTANTVNLFRGGNDILRTEDSVSVQASAATALQIQSAAGADTMFTVDTTTANIIKIGNSTGTGTATTQFVLDSATTAPSANGAGVNGAMYYDSTLGRIQCYQSGSWGKCGSIDQTITLTPEYAGAVMTGDGSNNTGTMTSDFCSGTTAPRLNINPAICGATEEHSYYSWTGQATNDYDIYIRYQLPSDFAGFSSSTAIQMFGRRSASTEKVRLSMYNSAGTQCGTTTEINSADNVWQQTALGGDETACSGLTAGSIVLFKINLEVGTNNNFARAGAINFSYKSR